MAHCLLREIHKNVTAFHKLVLLTVRCPEHKASEAKTFIHPKTEGMLILYFV